MSCFKYFFQSTPLLYTKEFSLSSVFCNFLKKILKSFFVRPFCLFTCFPTFSDIKRGAIGKRLTKNRLRGIIAVLKTVRNPPVLKQN